MKLLSTKIFVSFLLVITVLTSLILYLTYHTIRSNYYEYSTNELSDLNNTIIFQIQPYILQKQNKELDSLVKIIGRKVDNRITIILPSGVVIADSEAEPAKMENHINRPEIQQCIKEGKGKSLRFSNTIKRDMLYLALPVFHDNNIIAYSRVSLHSEKLDLLLIDLNGEILKIVVITLILSLFAILLFSRNISKPINQLIFASRKVAEGNFDIQVKVGKSNDELNELSENFNRMTLRIKKLFEKVTNQTEKLNTLITSVQDGFLVLNSKNEITLSNISFQNIVGQSNLNKQKLSKVLVNNDIINIVDETRAKQNYLTKEVLIDNKVYICSSNYLEAKNEVVLLIHNITELKKLEVYKKDFVINVSHELRTPLTAIKGFVETLEETASEEQFHYIEIIQRHTNRLINIVNDLLVLSELENPNFELNFEKVNLIDIFKNVEKLFFEKLKSKSLELKLSIKTDLPFITADSFRLEQVLINLVDNAIKYTDSGNITLNAFADRNNVIIEIQDTGVGIPPEDQARIFERFYIVDKSRSRKVGGTGLGLSIVKHIILQHKGEINIESRKGFGTKFIIKIPILNITNRIETEQ